MIRRLLFVVAMLLLAMPVAAQPVPARIVAVGDLHGDFSAWLDIARDAKLVDPANHWIGGKTILVQTGDMVDRGADSLKIIRHLQQLDGEAKRAGGRVIVLMGNHEAMQVIGDYRYVTPGEYAAFADRQSKARRDAAFAANAKVIIDYYHVKDASLSPKAIRAMWMTDTPLGKVEHDTAWAPTGELGRWVATLPAVAKVGDTLFVHGGISAKYALVPMDEINRRARAAIVADDSTEEAIINDQMGPLWYRGLVLRGGDDGIPAAGRPTIDNELAAALKGQGAKRLVIAHTPRLEGIGVLHNGTLIQIDTGISRYYHGKLGWLEILGDKLVAHAANRSVQ